MYTTLKVGEVLINIDTFFGFKSIFGFSFMTGNGGDRPQLLLSPDSFSVSSELAESKAKQEAASGTTSCIPVFLYKIEKKIIYNIRRVAFIILIGETIMKA